jgi:hypothetical protein
MILVHDLVVRCELYLKGDVGHEHAWRLLGDWTESRPAEMVAVVLDMFADEADDEQLSLLTSGPLWTLLETDAVTDVIVSRAKANGGLRAGIFAIERYSRKIFQLQTQLALLSGCEVVPTKFKSFSAAHELRAYADEGPRRRCVRIMGERIVDHDALGSPLGASIRAQWIRLLKEIEMREGADDDLVEEINTLLTFHESLSLPFAVRASITSSRFVCHLSKCTLFGLSEGAIDVLTIVARALQSEV